LTLKIISYNLNGIRSAISKGLLDWLASELPDILLIQETKARPDKIDVDAFKALGYEAFIHSAEKAGYSGVAIFTRITPDRVVVGCGIEKYDREGRVLRADFGNLSVLTTYFPSGSSGEDRQAFKMEFLSDFEQYVADLKQERPHLLIAGDYNICHQALDIHNPVSNKNSSGFLPEERKWVASFLEMGFVDTFRLKHQEGGRYSWWSFRFQARSKNLGWRIDYHMVSESLKPYVVNADIFEHVVHSDHCPILIELDTKNEL